MKIKNLIFFLLLIFLGSNPNLTFANACLGMGTVFVYGNGMFNTQEDALDSQDKVAEEIKRHVIVEQSKETKFDLAYKTNESEFIQYFNVANQKGMDNWEDFWLWLSSIKKAPEWFQDAVKLKAADALKNGSVAFDEIRQHFEDYSRYIREGYNIVLVSHSQGNLYANQAMRKLSDYTDSSLTGSLLDKKTKNSFFPEFFDIFSNVQVATPVSATINSSPWSTFIDDLIMDFVRRTPVGALPANLKTPGSNIPPDGDWKGHDFVKAYLRNDESRGKILSDIQTQYNKLKYPIGYFDKAVLLQSHWRHFGEGNNLHSQDASLNFDIVSGSNRDIGGVNEKRPNRNEIIYQSFAYCNDLSLGTSKIFLSVDSDEKKEVSFEVWPEGKKEGVKPALVSFPVKRGNSDWEVGTIQTEKGSGKEPLQVKVEIYPTPKPRSKKGISF